MKLIDALTAEHAVLRRLLEYVDSEAEGWTLEALRAGGATVSAALLSHAAIEDELLFGALAPHFGGQGPVAVMREEHRQIDEAYVRLAAAREAGEGRRALRRVNELALAHFAKEEAVLFRLADHVLTDPDLERLGRAWSERCNTSTLHHTQEAS